MMGTHETGFSFSSIMEKDIYFSMFGRRVSIFRSFGEGRVLPTSSTTLWILLAVFFWFHMCNLWLVGSM